MSFIMGNTGEKAPKTFFFATIALIAENLVLDFLGPKERII